MRRYLRPVGSGDFARWTARYDDKGRCLEETFYGEDNKPRLVADGYARVTARWEGEMAERAYYGADLRPVIVTRRADLGRELRLITAVDTEAAPLLDDSSIPEDRVRTALRFWTQVSMLVTRGELLNSRRSKDWMRDTSEIARLVELDDHLMKKYYIPIAGGDAPDRLMTSFARISQSFSGDRLVRERIWITSDDAAGPSLEWSREGGSVLSLRLLDGEGKTTLSSAGYAGVRMEYSAGTTDGARLSKAAFLNREGRPIACRGYAAAIYRWTDSGLPTEIAFQDLDGKPCARDGGTWAIRYVDFLADPKHTGPGPYFGRDNKALENHVVVAQLTSLEDQEKWGLVPGEEVVAYADVPITCVAQLLALMEDARSRHREAEASDGRDGVVPNSLVKMKLRPLPSTGAALAQSGARERVVMVPAGGLPVRFVDLVGSGRRPGMGLSSFFGSDSLMLIGD
jgi:hypothetical protein